MTEDQLEQETLGWLAEAGYTHLYGPDIAPDGSNPERADYRQVILRARLSDAIHRLNPAIPTAAKDDALKQILDLGIPALLSAILTKRDISAQRRTDEQRELAIRQIIGSAVVSEEVVDIFNAVGLDKPNIGILDDAFLADVRNLPERNLAVELLERLLEGEIKSRFSGNVVQNKKFSDLLGDVIKRYQNRAIEPPDRSLLIH